jgi:hypothetical protein
MDGSYLSLLLMFVSRRSWRIGAIVNFKLVRCYRSWFEEEKCPAHEIQIHLEHNISGKIVIIEHAALLDNKDHANTVLLLFIHYETVLA